MTTRRRASNVLTETIGPLSFGSFLRAARTGLEFTQDQMAISLGVTKSIICDIEKGRQLVSPVLARKIARKARLSEKLAVTLALQDQLKKAKIAYEVTLKRETEVDHLQVRRKVKLPVGAAPRCRHCSKPSAPGSVHGAVQTVSRVPVRLLPEAPSRRLAFPRSEEDQST